MKKGFTDKFESIFRSALPSPLAIAILLTCLTFFLSYFFGENQTLSSTVHNWYSGMWSASSLAFLVQMMLMLVLGHIVALSPLVTRFIQSITARCTSQKSAIWITCVSTISLSLINWGLGLIFGAILVRSIRTHFAKQEIPVNAGLLGACGYSGLLFWHGGLSGSAPLKVAESGHLQSLLPEAALPEFIGFTETVFYWPNLVVMLLALTLTPLLMQWIGKQSKATVETNSWDNLPPHSSAPKKAKLFAEKIDAGKSALVIGGIVLAASIFLAVTSATSQPLGFINPNYINFSLLGLALLLHQSFNRFSEAANEAIGDATGILIQFPLYFGIMGLMNNSGLGSQIATAFTNISTPETFPILTIINAGLLNLFVPSGGGQWVIQGPILCQAALELNVPLNKMILAFSYGDQLTNMLQPFWALPLLGITKLEAKQLLPYTLALFAFGFALFCFGVMLA